MPASPQKSAVVSHLRGPLFALLAAVLFGISPPLAKWLVNTTNPHLLAGLLYLGSGVGLGAMLLIRRLWTPSTAEIVVSHNHPSGDPAPSSADVQLTHQLREASKSSGSTCSTM